MCGPEVVEDGAVEAGGDKARAWAWAWGCESDRDRDLDGGRESDLDRDCDRDRDRDRERFRSDRTTSDRSEMDANPGAGWYGYDTGGRRPGR